MYHKIFKGGPNFEHISDIRFPLLHINWLRFVAQCFDLREYERIKLKNLNQFPLGLKNYIVFVLPSPVKACA